MSFRTRTLRLIAAVSGLYMLAAILLLTVSGTWRYEQPLTIVHVVPRKTLHDRAFVEKHYFSSLLERFREFGLQDTSVLIDNGFRRLMQEVSSETDDASVNDILDNHADVAGVQKNTERDRPWRSFNATLRKGFRCAGLKAGYKGNLSFLGSGWTKTVLQGTVGNKSVAIKFVDLNGENVQRCLRGYNATERQTLKALQNCYADAARKIITEFILLHHLSHDNIVKVHAFCPPEKPYDGTEASLVSMATELGEKINIIKLLQVSWADRLRISRGLTNLLYFLARSPLGPIALNDFRREQFVLVSGELKLTDIDYIGVRDPSCQRHSDCQAYYYNINTTVRTECTNGRCEGYNEKRNIILAGRHFTGFMLSHGVPGNLLPLVKEIEEGYNTAELDTSQLKILVDKLIHQYSSGLYISSNAVGDPQDKLKYKVVEHHDLPGMFDYMCRHHAVASTCAVSVYDEAEAESVCDADPQCQAFVVAPARTWTGRMMVLLKSNSTSPVSSQGFHLHIKNL